MTLRRRLTVLVTAVILMPVVLVTNAVAVTKVTVTNPGGLIAAGPVSTANGFPTYYEDSNHTRIEACLNGDDPFCGFLPGNIPDPTMPIDFPGNFPSEYFYQLAASNLTLSNGGKVALTLGLEAAFANGDPVNGDQVVFARTRVVVRNGPANTTLTFKHPFGELTIDTDGTGAGRLVQDISPAVGNFTAALAGNFGPFLKWDPAVSPAAPAGYLGDPGVLHAITGGKNGYNLFSMSLADGTVVSSTDQFTVSGKVATNTGVTGDLVQVNGTYLDVFATSAGDQIQIDGVPGSFATTPMSNDSGSSRHYARIAFTGPAPTQVTVRNLGDKPVSTAVIKLADVSVVKADYDGTARVLSVKAVGLTPELTVVGFGSITSGQSTDFTKVYAPPAVISVRSATGAPVSFPVTIVAGAASDPALPPTPVDTTQGPVNDNTPNNPNPPAVPAPVATIAAPAATVPGGSVTLDGTTAGATSYAWTQVTAPAGTTIANATTAKPTVTLPYSTTISATAPAPAPVPVVFRLTATNSGGSSTTSVTIPGKTDTLTVGTARHRLGTELRITGTSLLAGGPLALTPPTNVVIYDTTPNRTVTKLGTAQVDTTGAWSLRLLTGPSIQVTSVLIQSTRGGIISTPVTNR